MSSAEVEALAMVLILLGFGTFTLVGLKMWFGYRVKRLEATAGSSEPVERLAADLDEMRDHVLAMRDEMTDLSERMEFAERMLTKGQVSE